MRRSFSMRNFGFEERPRLYRNPLQNWFPGAPMPETGRQQFGREPSRQNPVRIPDIELFGRPSEQIRFWREREQPVPVGTVDKK
jgi:hypothetical protein